MIAVAPREPDLLLEPPALPAAPPSRRSCEAASRFGLLIDEHALAPRREPLRVRCAPGTVTLLTGPSGAGKSTALSLLEAALRERGVRALRLSEVRLRESPAVDLLPGTVDEAVRALARVGLGQASCFLRRPRELSDGQRWRLRLAVALDTLERSRASRTALVIDECCATLDPCSAMGACAALRRAADRVPGLCVAAAGASPLLTEWLRPDEVIRFDMLGEARVTNPSRVDRPSPFVIERATMREYAALAPTHYRDTRPSRPALVLCARLRDGSCETPVGALVVTSPPLNSSLRERAWPGRYRGPDKRENARRLNAEVRTIARVVVDERLRGMGLATDLVREYLRAPLTVRTETLGAMPGVTGCFERAGMTRHELPVREADARLLDALAHAGVEPWRLAQGLPALARAVESAGRPFVERELRSWARFGRAHLRYADHPLEELFLRACRFAACASAGFTHDTGA